MLRNVLPIALLFTAAVLPAEARTRYASKFLTLLDRNGDLSAGWVQVLPMLANACNFRLDNQELTDKLVDLSRATGNVSYTRDLYTTLYMIENHRTSNRFVEAWTARFDGRQKDACDTAEALWGDTGRQFPGVLKHVAMNDTAGMIPPGSAPNNCK